MRLPHDEKDIRSIERGVDKGIGLAVGILLRNGVETFESCEGGTDHAFTQPTIRFYISSPGSIWKAVEILIQHGLPIYEVRITWDILDGLPTGPHGEVTFRRKMEPVKGDSHD